MIRLELERKLCKNGGSGTWVIVFVEGEWTLGWWLSFGLPLWTWPRIIWKQMEVRPGVRNAFDFGFGWLFFCTRLALQVRD